MMCPIWSSHWPFYIKPGTTIATQNYTEQNDVSIRILDFDYLDTDYSIIFIFTILNSNMWFQAKMYINKQFFSLEIYVCFYTFSQYIHLCHFQSLVCIAYIILAVAWLKHKNNMLILFLLKFRHISQNVKNTHNPGRLTLMIRILKLCKNWSLSSIN